MDLAACGLAMPIALFPLINELRFGGDPRTLGLFLSAIAVGGITAGAFSGAITRLRHSGAVQLTAACIWGLALAGFGMAGPVWVALGCLAIAGAADSVSVFTRARSSNSTPRTTTAGESPRSSTSSGSPDPRSGTSGADWSHR